MKQIQESFSALMDNEGDEFDLRRVLKKEHTVESGETWRRYHLARSMMRRERDAVVDADISADVMKALRDEPLPGSASDQAPAAQKRHSFSMMGGAAVAAAVSLMVITGVQVYNGRFADSTSGGDVASMSPSQDTSSFASPNDVSVANGANGVMPASMQAPASDGLPFFSMNGQGGGIMTVGENIAGPSLLSNGDGRMDDAMRPYFERRPLGESSADADNWASLLRSSGTYASQLHDVGARDIR